MTGIREDVEKRFFEFLSDVGDKIGAERIEHLVESALTGAARTKKAVDKNVETFLSIANIPSRRDYDRMRAKLDALQGSVINLTRTVDDLRNRLASANGSASGARAHRAAKRRTSHKPAAAASYATQVGDKPIPSVAQSAARAAASSTLPKAKKARASAPKARPRTTR